MNSSRTIALKRISRDILEIQNNPLEGIGIAPFESDPMKYIINIKLMTGVYEGFCIQLLLIFNDSYPTKPPKILIFPNQFGGMHFHHHVFQERFGSEYQEYYGFCIDFLENNYLDTTIENSGWNPSYSISSILLQVQNFLGDPDMDVLKDLPNMLLNQMNNYKKSFEVINDKGEKEIKIHTWKNPYPSMYFSDPVDVISTTMSKSNLDDDEIKRQKIKIKFLKENLTCYMMKDDYIDDNDILLGYPVVKKQISKGIGKTYFELYPIPELISFEGFNAQSTQGQNAEKKIGMFFNNTQTNRFKSARNTYYDTWIPIYIDKNHYEKNKNRILESFAKFRNDPYNNMNLNMNQNIPLDPQNVFEYLPLLLNKMIIGMFKGESMISSAFITCYFQYALLFKKMTQEYSYEFKKYLDSKLNIIKNNHYRINKKLIPDIGDFFVLLFFCDKAQINEETWNCLFQEYISRQMYWVFHGDECKPTMKALILKNCCGAEKLSEYQIDSLLNLLKFGNINSTRDQFISILITLSIFNDIYELIINDENLKNTKMQNFKKYYKPEDILCCYYSEVSLATKNKIKEILGKCDYKSFYDILSYPLTESNTYDSNNVDELLSKIDKNNLTDILKYAYESQRGNQLLLITFFTKKKMDDIGFMEELEKNYGVFLKVDDFIKGMKTKLKEIKSYKELYKYIGCSFAEGKEDIDLIIDAYKRAFHKNNLLNLERNQNYGYGQYNNNYNLRRYSPYRGGYFNNFYRYYPFRRNAGYNNPFLRKRRRDDNQLMSPYSLNYFTGYRGRARGFGRGYSRGRFARRGRGFGRGRGFRGRGYGYFNRGVYRGRGYGYFNRGVYRGRGYYYRNRYRNNRGNNMSLSRSKSKSPSH